MARKLVTAPERLRLLLPWLNGDACAAGGTLDSFLFACMDAWGDGTELVCSVGPGAFTPSQESALRRDLLRLLETTVGDQVQWWSLGSLRFTARRRRQKPAKLPKSAAGRREALGPGAFAFAVDGLRRDVLLYAFLRTLTEPGAVRLSRCPAPAPRDWSRTCGRFLVSGGHVGQPATYCSTACRVRAARQKESERGDR